MIDWLEANYTARLIVGLAFFALVLAWDVARHGKAATRPGEYGFLVFTAGVAIAYAIVHDQITVTISDGYFAKFKGLTSEKHMRRDVTLLALKASYGPGLIVGALLLIANNPSKKLEALPYRRLARIALLPLATAALGAITGGVWCKLAPPAEILEDARETFIESAVRPFVVVWGVHWGTYVGMALGTVVAVVQVRRSRAARPEATIPP